jgi:iron complex outermembrane receptor protein
MRTTWGRGFKAPTLPEVTASLSFIPTTVTDPVTGGSSTIVASLGGNPNLEPEKSRTFTAGIVFEPSASFSVGIDFYQINWTNQVAFEDLQTLVNSPNDPRVFRDPTTGLIRSVSTTYINLNAISTQGVDIDIRYRTNSKYGRLGTRLVANYVDSYEMEGTEYAGTDGAWLVSNASAVPRWKGQWSFDWEQGPWTAQLTLNYMHHYWRTYGMTAAPSFFRPGAATAIPQTGQLDQKSPSYTTLDLYARYNVTPKLSISGSVVNLTDEMPPFDPSFSQTYFHDRGTGFDVRGRIYRVGAQYRF